MPDLASLVPCFRKIWSKKNFKLFIVGKVLLKEEAPMSSASFRVQELSLQAMRARFVLDFACQGLKRIRWKALDTQHGK